MHFGTVSHIKFSEHPFIHNLLCIRATDSSFINTPEEKKSIWCFSTVYLKCLVSKDSDIWSEDNKNKHSKRQITAMHALLAADNGCFLLCFFSFPVIGVNFLCVHVFIRASSCCGVFALSSQSLRGADTPSLRSVLNQATHNWCESGDLIILLGPTLQQNFLACPRCAL